MSGYNPRVRDVVQMCENISKIHAGELNFMKLEWLELKDAAGDVYQIVPLLDVHFK